MPEPDSAEKEKPKKKKKSAATTSDPFDADKVSYEDCKVLISPSFRPLRPSVAALVGYGVYDYSYMVADANTLLRLAARRSDVNDEREEGSMSASGNEQQIYPVNLTNNSIAQLLSHVSSSLENLQVSMKNSSFTSVSTRMGLSHTEDLQPIGECGITTVRTYLNVLYENRVFIALYKITSNIISSLNSDDPGSSNSDDAGCLFVDVEDDEKFKLMLGHVLKILVGVFSSDGLLDEVIDAYEHRYDDPVQGDRSSLSAPLLFRILNHLVNGEVTASNISIIYYILRTHFFLEKSFNIFFNPWQI